MDRNQFNIFTMNTCLYFQVATGDCDDDDDIDTSEEAQEKPIKHQYLPVHSPKLPTREESTERYVVMKHDTKGYRRS